MMPSRGVTVPDHGFDAADDGGADEDLHHGAKLQYRTGR